jgi:uncharacterized protein (UPF0333 family)
LVGLVTQETLARNVTNFKKLETAYSFMSVAMLKRGQLSFYLVCSLVVLIVILVLSNTVLQVEDLQTDTAFPLLISTDAEIIKHSVTTCLKTITQDSLSFVAMQGGFFTPPYSSLNYTIAPSNISVFIPYYFVKAQGIQETQNVQLIPSIATIEQQLSQAITTFFPLCFDASEISEKTGINITPDFTALQASPHIYEGGVKVNLAFPITLSYKDTPQNLGVFSTDVKSSIFTLHMLAQNLASVQSAQNNSICITCMADIVETVNASLEMNQMQDDADLIIVYGLEDADRELLFSFAHKFHLPETTDDPSIGLELDVNEEVGEEAS